MTRFTYGLLFVLALSLCLNVWLMARLITLPIDVLEVPEFDLQKVRRESSAQVSPAADPVPEDAQDSAHQSLILRASDAFKRQAFAEAVEYLVELERLAAPLANQLRYAWFERASRWIQQGKLTRFEQFSQAYTGRYLDDLDFYRLEVNALIAQDKVEDASLLLYQLQVYAEEQAVQQSLAREARKLAHRLAEELMARSAWASLQHFALSLLEQEYHYVPYAIWLARARYENKDYELARQALLPWLDDSEYGAQARDLLSAIDKKALAAQAIVLSRVGEHYIAKGRFSSANEVGLLLDTGASISLLSREAFERIQGDVGYQYQGVIQLSTAGGQVQAEVYRFAEFALGDYKVAGIDFAISDLDLGPEDGLLGMNYLRQFDFRLDQDESVLFLEYK